MSITYRKELKDLKPYVPGKPIEDVQREYNLDRVVKLASNENPLGCSEKVKEEISKHLDSLGLYPDGNATKLKEELSKKLNVPTNQILPSNGADEMIDLVSKTFLAPGDEVVMSDTTFPRYIATAKMMGATPVVVPLKDYTYDLDSMLDKITDKTKVIWICNPNNPTGTIVSEEELIEFFDKVPKDIVIAYDEAYREFARSDEYPRESLNFLKDYPNILVMRTFSKAYGLAGIRVGYAVAEEEIIENINKVRGPFNVNSLGQVAAITALNDEDFIDEILELNSEGMDYLTSEFEDMGFFFPESHTNHIFVDVERNGQEVFEELQKKGVIIRPMAGNFVRVSIGNMEENKIFIKELRELLGK